MTPEPTAPARRLRRTHTLPPRGSITRRATGYTLAAAVLAGGIDVGTMGRHEPATCAEGQIPVTVPGVHIWGVAHVVAASPVRKREPWLRDVVAEHAPDVPISTVVEANGLDGPMTAVPATEGGVFCLRLSGTAAAPSKAKTSAKAKSSGAAVTAAQLAVPARARVGDVTIARAAHQAGFRGDDLTTAVAVALAESAGDTRAVCNNVRRGGRVTCSARRTADTISSDRGLWQINNRAHPHISDDCAFDPDCSARYARHLAQKTPQGWRHWVAYQSGSWRTGGRLQRAQAAAAAVTA